MRSVATMAMTFSLLFLRAVPAGAGVATTPATYEGRVIDLAKSWEGAEACVVLAEDDARCFTTEAEMHAALEADGIALAPSQLGGGAEASSCSGFVTLYDNVNFGGASLSFGSTGWWLNLPDYGFNDRMESWRNNRNCAAFVAEHINAGGSQLALAANSQDNAVASSWKNRASSILA